jgi:hypothetical protein
MDFSIRSWSRTRLRRPVGLAGPSPEEQWKNRGEEPAREDEGMRAVELLVLMRDAVSIQ